MRRELSTYLDLLRLTAAIAVFASHLSWQRISGGFLWQFQFLGHDAVMVFFVLSGFVIQYSAASKEKSLFDYQVARFARLYSVVIPALVLTYLFDRIGIAHNSASYFLDRETSPLLRLMAGGLFLSQSWSWNLALLNNDAFWSLPYEFWYYQIFAAAIFFRGSARVVLIIGACLISGPAILIYFPLWLVGVAAYRASQLVSLAPEKARWIFGVTALGLLTIVTAEYYGEIVRSNAELWPRGFSPVDYLLAALIAANIFAASFLRLPLKLLAKPIRSAAGITFSLYLLHLPILHLVSAYTPVSLPAEVRGLTLATVTLAAVIALSFVTEKQKLKWRDIFQWLFISINNAKLSYTNPEHTVMPMAPTDIEVAKAPCRDASYSCPECGDSFQSTRAAVNHSIKTGHGYIPSKETPEK